MTILRSAEHLLDTLRRDGISLLPAGSLSPAQAADVAEYLRGTPCYPAHVKVHGDGVPRTFDEIRQTHDLWCHDMRDVVMAPHLLELVISLLPTVKVYLEARPNLYSINAFWARPSDDKPWKDLQTFHRDKDDKRFLALFVYGTDVLVPGDGPHRFVKGSHTFREDDVDNDSMNIYGPAGTAFLADTSGLHMGMKPHRGERLLIWARWGVSERPASYIWDKLEPVEVGERYHIDAETRELVKLVII